MNNAQFFLAAGDGEETFWVQLLVFMTLAAGWGVYVLARSRARRFKRAADDELIETVIGHRADGQAPADGIGKATQPQKKRNLKSGMGLLDRAFLVEVVERTEAADTHDVAMRSMCFYELMRRRELRALSSGALMVYTLDKEGFFDKTIRREAMAELAGRTGKEYADSCPPRIADDVESVQFTNTRQSKVS
ncbi:MAG: hypothetical protein JW749_07195 [Sedimentisphaerales bacterium]|nr:hypothetical protein [Sedimentisphaerales bacterium]